MPLNPCFHGTFAYGFGLALNRGTTLALLLSCLVWLPPGVVEAMDDGTAYPFESIVNIGYWLWTMSIICAAFLIRADSRMVDTSRSV